MSDGYIVVIAIDFGTTFSGYAFSMRSDKNDIKMNKSWGAEVGFQAYKTPTTVMLNPDGSLNSFGFQAQNGYADLDADEIKKGYQLFQRFKMELYEHKKLDSNITIKSTTGAQKPAVDIIAKALRYMKNHCLEAISKTGASRVRNDYIRWVITVPAIWSDTAKKIMRLAAKKAGLVDDELSKNLIIALEPEAASLYCRTLAMETFIGSRGLRGEMAMNPGEKYMIVDCGGGTIDIAIHEVLRNGTVQEVKGASGGPWGGIYVDKKYFELLDVIFGVNFMNKLKSDHPSTWLSMLVDFETKKRAANPENATGINMIISLQFAKQFEKHSGEDVEERIKKKKRLGVKYSNGMLRISGDTVRSMYSEVIPEIRDHLKQILRRNNHFNISKMFVVGGFAESAYLKECLTSEFERTLKIFIPEEAGMCVMKGAVMFGHDTEVITCRIARFNYAVCARVYFQHGTDNPSRRIIREDTGKEYIDYLERYIDKGQKINVNDIIERTYQPYKASTTTVELPLCCTEHDTNDPGDPSVTLLEKITIHSPHVHIQKRDIKVFLRFGATDILFRAVDVESGNKVESTVQF